MNNFELHEAAQTLADTTTPYNLARQVVELTEALEEAEGKLAQLDNMLPCGLDEMLGE